MAQLDGSPVIALPVLQRIQRQFLAMLEIGLGGIETEREVLVGDVHLQLVQPLRIVGGTAELAKGVHLVQLAGDIHVPGGHIAVQFVEQSPSGMVQTVTVAACGDQQEDDRTGQTDANLRAHGTKIGII